MKGSLIRYAGGAAAAAGIALAMSTGALAGNSADMSHGQQNYSQRGGGNIYYGDYNAGRGSSNSNYNRQGGGDIYYGSYNGGSYGYGNGGSYNNNCGCEMSGSGSGMWYNNQWYSYSQMGYRNNCGQWVSYNQNWNDNDWQQWRDQGCL